ncbi:F-box/WD repeat-containing protein 5 isoform X1 [Mesoplodon densirostris]|uniref:F-box/WD repeat-containing protein 5 isoform X1 n=1 Tax=Mesoplodon densirostris TaxID=48708 RepID=UPI0028DBF825|nr:F-box/WD repeat-containing protein 5 isoform X1 [Mesoplodon densirostris]XP_059958042.1 F-box/WD repeat-containing protein 5 isoform X1 [Mesoplodon densirostris]
MDEGGIPLLPDSLVYQIFLNLGPADVLAAGLVCHQWQAVSRDEFLWREQFYRYYQVARNVPRHPAATSWYEEFRRLYDTVPCVEVQTLREHTDQVLHLSFSHSGYQFASCSKDCTVKIWSNDLTISLLHSADMRPYNWSYTQFSQFNQDDSLLLASGVFLGPHNSSSGEIAVISLDTFALLSRVRNKPYDVFGCWLTDTSLISGNLHRIGDITSCSVLWLNNAFQDVESENVNVVKRLFKIQNLNASTIRTVMVADCSRFDSPELLLDAGAPGADPGCVFDLSSDSEDQVVDPGPARSKGLRRLLEGRAQPQLSECALETKAAELLAQGHTKPPERSTAAAGNKLLIFTTGCFTYSPHQIGIKQILPHQMTTAGPVLGEGRGSDAFFDALDHVIDVHGHIIGMGLSPDNRWASVGSLGGGVRRPLLRSVPTQVPVRKQPRLAQRLGGGRPHAAATDRGGDRPAGVRPQDHAGGEAGPARPPRLHAQRRVLLHLPGCQQGLRGQWGRGSARLRLGPPLQHLPGQAAAPGRGQLSGLQPPGAGAPADSQRRRHHQSLALTTHCACPPGPAPAPAPLFLLVRQPEALRGAGTHRGGHGGPWPFSGG